MVFAALLETMAVQGFGGFAEVPVRGSAEGAAGRVWADGGRIAHLGNSTVDRVPGLGEPDHQHAWLRTIARERERSTWNLRAGLPRWSGVGPV